MIVKDLNLNELRKRYAVDNKDTYVMRIRDRYGKNKEDKKNNADNKNIDIVYYNGRKMLSIKNGKNNNDINIFDNIFKLNKANIRKAFESMKKGSNYDIVTATINLRNALKDYYQFELNKIKLKPSTKIESKKRLVISILKSLKEELSDYINKGFIADFEPYAIYNTLLKGKDYELVIKKDNGLSTEDIVKIEYIFLKNCLFKKETQEEKVVYVPYENGRNGLAKPDIDLKIKEVLEKENIVYERKKIRGKIARVIDINELENFELDLKNAIGNYNENTKYDMEKIYQYQFMVRDTSYKCDEFKDMYKFEMEYPTNEGDKEKGRIDNIFVKVDNNTNTAEAYLIELKVDEGVLGGTNGIHKHLIDIEKIYEQNRLEDFLDDLQERVNYRIKELLCNEEKNNFKPVNLNKTKLNFWVVIALSEEDGTYLDNAKKIQEMMKNLENEKYIENEKCNEKNPLPQKSEVLSKHIERLKKEKCEVKIVYDSWEASGEKEMKYNISNDVFFTDLDSYIKEIENNK